MEEGGVVLMTFAYIEHAGAPSSCSHAPWGGGEQGGPREEWLDPPQSVHCAVACAWNHANGFPLQETCENRRALEDREGC